MASAGRDRNNSRRFPSECTIRANIRKSDNVPHSILSRDCRDMSGETRPMTTPATLLHRALLALLLSGASLAAADPVKTAAETGLLLGPDTTVITGPLDEHGYPDYVAALNERMAEGVAREDNFWVLMWPLLGNAERSSEEYVAAVERMLEVQIDRQPRLGAGNATVNQAFTSAPGKEVVVLTRPWTRDEAPELADWLDRHADELKQVEIACRRPQAYAPLIASPTGSMRVVSILLPHAQQLRGVARLVTARALLHIGEGTHEAAWQDILTLHRLALQSERGFTLIESLIGYAIRSMALAPLSHWIARSELSAAELDAHWVELAPLMQLSSLARSVDLERYMYLEVVQSLAARRGTSPDEVSLLDSFPGAATSADDLALIDSLRNARKLLFQFAFLASDVNETLRYGNRMYDELVAVLKEDQHGVRAVRLKQIEARTEQDSRKFRTTGALAKTYLFSSREELRQMPGMALFGVLMPAMASVETAYTRTQTYPRLVRGAFLVRRHLSDGGDLPLDLSEISGADTADLTDPFSEGEVLLLADKRGLVLYSVGPNGIDNAGKRQDEGDQCDDIRLVLPVAP